MCADILIFVAQYFKKKRKFPRIIARKLHLVVVFCRGLLMVSRSYAAIFMVIKSVVDFCVFLSNYPQRRLLLATL